MAARRTSALPTLEWTGNPEADALVAADPLALLIGFCLDQQITVEKAFMGPLVIRERLGTIDARRLASMDPAAVEAAFRQVPAIHRFPASMAARVQKLCASVATGYGGDARRIWSQAGDSPDLLKRLGELPGFGRMKARLVFAVLVKHFGVHLEGWERELPDFPTLADVSTVAEREAYQAAKRAHKAAARAQAGKTEC